MEDRRGRPRIQTRIQSFLRSHRNDPVRRILILLLCASLVVFYFHALLYHDVGSGLHVMQSNGILDANVTVLSAPLYTGPGSDISSMSAMLQPRSLADVVIANAEVTLKKRLDRDERVRKWELQQQQKKLDQVQKIQLELQQRREKLHELEGKIKLRQRQYPDGVGGNERLEKEQQKSLEELRLRQIKIKQMEANLQDQQQNLRISGSPTNDQRTLFDEEISKVEEGFLGSPISNRTYINFTLHTNGTMPRVLRNSVSTTNKSSGPNPNHFFFFWIFILSVRMCTVVLHNRMILALQSTQLSDSDHDVGAEGSEDGGEGSGGDGGERRGLLGGGLSLGLRQRRAPPQARPSIAARIIDRRFRRFVDALNSQRIANGERPMDVDTLRRLAHGRDFTGNDYDALYNFVDENGPAMASFHAAMGATAAEIGRLPTRTVGETQQGDDDLLRENSTCPVCLERYAVGEVVRTIPCFHTFHSTCIDPWLAQRAECPVCKHSAIG